jgi:hypothetical protein
MAGEIRLKNEGFEEPGGVRQMPFRWAGICHPLKAKIFRFKTCNQDFTATPHLHQGVKQQGVKESLRDPKS